MNNKIVLSLALLVTTSAFAMQGLPRPDEAAMARDGRSAKTYAELLAEHNARELKRLLKQQAHAELVNGNAAGSAAARAQAVAAAIAAANQENPGVAHEPQS